MSEKSSITFRALPGGVKEIKFEKNGSTLAEVLGAAGVSYEGMTITVNGQPANGETRVNSGDKAVAAEDVKGA